MNEYLRLAPRVEIDVRDIPSGFQGEALIDRKIDVGFMRPPIDAPQLVSASLFQEPFSVVLRRANPLAKRKTLHLRDLADETLLLINRQISPGVYDRTLALFREHGIKPKTISTATMSYEEAGSILVDSGKGIYIAVGRNPIHPSFTDRLIVLPLNESSAVADVHLVWRRDEQSKTTLDFVKFTRDALQHNTGLVSDHNLSGNKENRGRLFSRTSRGRKAVRSKNR